MVKNKLKQVNQRLKPLIVVNFKAYKEGLGEQGIELIKSLSIFNNVLMVIPAPLINLAANYYCNNTKCQAKTRILAQHVDPIISGAYTGSVTIDEVVTAGATGSLVNHSEKRINFESIKIIVNELKNKKLTSIVCCQNINEALRIKELKPDYIAYEPPELIGGDVSVSETKPAIIKELVKKVKPIKVLVGAGVKTRSDIQKIIELGAQGVLIASGIIKAVNKEKVINELIKW